MDVLGLCELQLRYQGGRNLSCTGPEAATVPWQAGAEVGERGERGVADEEYYQRRGKAPPFQARRRRGSPLTGDGEMPDHPEASSHLVGAEVKQG